MRSDWIRVSPFSLMTGVLMGHVKSQTHREKCPVVTEAEVEMQLQARQHQGLPTTRKWERRGRSLPWGLQKGAWPCRHIDWDFWPPEL